MRVSKEPSELYQSIYTNVRKKQELSITTSRHFAIQGNKCEQIIRLKVRSNGCLPIIPDTWEAETAIL
jgi:hypothetical protein